MTQLKIYSIKLDMHGAIFFTKRREERKQSNDIFTNAFVDGLSIAKQSKKTCGLKWN